MDSFEFNKIAGAVLGTALAVMAVKIIADAIYTPGEPTKPGYEVAVAPSAEGGAAGGEAAQAGGGGVPQAGGGAPAVTPIAVRLQTADPKVGETKARICMACHNFNQGGGTKVGPDLYGVVGSPVLYHADFGYSQAMQEKGKQGMTWTFDNLDKFLTDPQGFIPGTAMTYAGMKDATDRANVIDFLRTNADSPVPLPAATAGGAPAQAPAAAAPSAPAEQQAQAPAAPAPRRRPHRLRQRRRRRPRRRRHRPRRLQLHPLRLPRPRAGHPMTSRLHWRPRTSALARPRRRYAWRVTT